MPNKQPSFADRCAKMQQIASMLKDCAEAVGLEAIHMAAAAKRFSERRSNNRKADR